MIILYLEGFALKRTKSVYLFVSGEKKKGEGNPCV